MHDHTHSCAPDKYH